MDLLCDAAEYKLIRNHVDVVYYNGDTPREEKKTQQLIEKNISLLIANDIWSESHPKMIDDWHFLRHYYHQRNERTTE